MTLPRLSIYFPTGSFAEAYQRFQDGRPQLYASHDELIRLANSLLETGVGVRYTSVVSAESAVSEPIDGLEFVELGAPDFTAIGQVRETLAADDSDYIIGHFPAIELMRSMLATDARLMMILADSYNRRSVRDRIRTKRAIKLLGHDRFEWVANHCLPSTQHLARLGVPATKLLPWDVPHASVPEQRPPRDLDTTPPYTLFAAGSISEEKGTSDLIDAIGILTRRGTPVRAIIAGSGEIEAMRTRAEESGIADHVDFLGAVPNEQVLSGMSSADLVVVASRHAFPEGMPLTLFEALASRTPIVCSDHPMFVSHFVDGLSASAFTSPDPQSLADAIERTLHDPDLYRGLSERAERTYEELGRGTVDYSTMIREWVRPSDPDLLTRHSLANFAG